VFQNILKNQLCCEILAVMQNYNDEPSIRIRIAEYIGLNPPELREITDASPQEAINEALNVAMLFCEVFGVPGKIVPKQAVKELIDNLVHAEFKGALISLINGEIVRVSDKGPGIEDKERAFEVGYSEAKPEALKEIRGVGAGLGVARAAVENAGGSVTLDDNLGGGTVAMISMVESKQKPSNVRLQPEGSQNKISGLPHRHQLVLMTVLEHGDPLGPSAISDRLDISPSTAYRDLATLARHGLVTQDPDLHPGRYAITSLGAEQLEEILGIQGPALDEAVSKILAAVENSIDQDDPKTLLKAIQAILPSIRKEHH
jgi:DNA-binding MarR family transcriptional regulator